MERSKTRRGSLRGLGVLTPVLIMVVTFNFSNSQTLVLGTEVLMDRPGAVETTTTAMREEARITAKAFASLTQISSWSPGVRRPGKIANCDTGTIAG